MTDEQKAKASKGVRKSLEGKVLGDYAMRQDNTHVNERQKRELPKLGDMDAFKTKRAAERKDIEMNYDLETGKHKTDPEAEPVDVYYEDGKKKVAKDGIVYDY